MTAKTTGMMLNMRSVHNAVIGADDSWFSLIAVMAPICSLRLLVRKKRMNVLKNSLSEILFSAFLAF